VRGGAGAKVIGAVASGENTQAGAGSVVVTSVPANATGVGVPGHIVACRDTSTNTIQRLPDPEWERLNELDRRLQELQRLVEHLEAHVRGLHDGHHGSAAEPAPREAGE